MGYSSLYIVQNFGPLSISMFSPFINILLTPVIIFIFKVGVCKTDLSYLKEKSKNQLMSGFWISFFDEMYLFLLVCSCLNLRNYFEWSNAGDAFNSLIALFFAILLAIFPIFVAIFYSRDSNFERIQNEDPLFTERYGSIIEGLNFKRQGRWVLIYPCASLLRKLWLSYMLMF